MTKIEKIEGIGEVYSAKLIEIGIKSVEQLLESSLTKKARAELAEKTGISEALRASIPSFWKPPVSTLLWNWPTASPKT